MNLAFNLFQSAAVLYSDFSLNTKNILHFHSLRMMFYMDSHVFLMRLR